MRIQWAEDDAVLALIAQPDLRIARETGVECLQGLPHLLLEVRDEDLGVPRLFQGLIETGAVGLEIRWQILIRVAEPVHAPSTQISLLRNRSRNACRTRFS